LLPLLTLVEYISLKHKLLEIKLISLRFPLVESIKRLPVKPDGQVIVKYRLKLTALYRRIGTYRPPYGISGTFKSAKTIFLIAEDEKLLLFSKKGVVIITPP
jgi:hypothetical protein